MTKTKTQPSQSPEHDPVGTFEHAVVTLFDGPLASVGFPGVDRTILADAVRAANEAQVVLEAAERDLEHARRALGDKLGELARLSRKAVAYARVLAEDDATLAEELETLSPRAAEPVRTPRKRRSKSDATAMLPLSTQEASGDEEVDEIAAE